MQGGSLSDWLASLSVPALGIGILITMFGALWLGQYVRRAQLRHNPGRDKESESSVAQEGYLLGSVLGLLGLLLAFSFGMALNRYESRRELVTLEANAIGTAYLRAQMLDEPHRSRLSALLVDYTDNRIRLADSGGTSNPYLARNDALLTQIWAAVRAARESALTHGVSTALLMTFNDVIDRDTERKLAWSLRLPVEVLILIIVYIGITAAVIGHQVDGPRGRRAAILMFVMIALSITVIADLNRPLSGHARESQKPMEMLLASLRSQPPRVFDQFSTPRTQASGVTRQ